MTTTKVGMNAQCVSIRSREHPGERCSNKAQAGLEWCGKHKTTQRRFAIAAAGDVIEHSIPSPPRRQPSETAVCPETAARFAPTLFRVWRQWLARRAGPLLWYRKEANNPFDFFSADPVGEIPLRDIVSFVDSKGKGYIMDIASAVSLLDHAKANNEAPMNPFNREPLPAAFLRRVALHGAAAKPQEALKPQTEEQRLSLAVTDVFRAIEDLGYYTDPAWFMELPRVSLQRLYLELADIWYHRASLTAADRGRIVPAPACPFPLSPSAVLVMPLKALRPLLLETCKLLVSAAPARADKQTGVMYVLGGLCILSAGAGAAYPWLVEMFAPGRVTQASGNQVVVLHPSVLSY